MILCLDVGNSQIFGGVFDSDKLVFQFRKSSKTGQTSDEIGLFLKNVLKENSIDPNLIRHISICCVVPESMYSLKNACKKYFEIEPFVLQAGSKTGLKIKYKNPLEVGSDRIATAIAANHLFPEDNLLVIDFGTATTLCAVGSNKEYLGGVILPGMKISMQALETNTSKLPAVEILQPQNCLGKSTVESIQSGLYFGFLGAISKIVNRVSEEVFNGQKPKVIATGGFYRLFAKESLLKIDEQNIFDEEVPDLVLSGLRLALMRNV